MIELSRSLHNGFVVGHFAVRADNGTIITVHLKNENLVAYEGEQPLATTPDIIMPFDQVDAQPLTVELLEIGREISILCFKSDPVWLTDQGLSLVGPRAFGFDTDYVQR